MPSVIEKLEQAYAWGNRLRAAHGYSLCSSYIPWSETPFFLFFKFRSITCIARGRTMAAAELDFRARLAELTLAALQ